MKTLLFVLFLSNISFAATDTMQLQRVIMDDGEQVTDSYVDNFTPWGSLTIETDGNNVIRRMEYDAWIRGEEPIVDDKGVVLDYTLNGARYELFNLLTNETWFVRFLRRAPENDSFDPATILLLDQEDGSTLILDYRYK